MENARMENKEENFLEIPKRICAACEYWHLALGEEFAKKIKEGADVEFTLGECRRYPPRCGITYDSAGEYPKTVGVWFCGEFSPSIPF